MAVTGWMLLRIGALLAGCAALVAVFVWDWPPAEVRARLTLALAVAWFAGRVGQWADDAVRKRGGR